MIQQHNIIQMTKEILSNLATFLMFNPPGTVGCIWYFAFIFLVYDTPASHPRITIEEKIYIETARGTHHTVSQFIE